MTNCTITKEHCEHVYEITRNAKGSYHGEQLISIATEYSSISLTLLEEQGNKLHVTTILHCTSISYKKTS